MKIFCLTDFIASCDQYCFVGTFCVTFQFILQMRNTIYSACNLSDKTETESHVTENIIVELFLESSINIVILHNILAQVKRKLHAFAN
jgi:hypothetical protein